MTREEALQRRLLACRRGASLEAQARRERDARRDRGELHRSQGAVDTRGHTKDEREALRLFRLGW